MSAPRCPNGCAVDYSGWQGPCLVCGATLRRRRGHAWTASGLGPRGDDPRSCRRCGARRRTVPGDAPHGARSVYLVPGRADWSTERPPCLDELDAALALESHQAGRLVEPEHVEPVSPSVSSVDGTPVIGLPDGATVQLGLLGVRPQALYRGRMVGLRSCPYCGRLFFPWSADGRGRGRPKVHCQDRPCLLAHYQDHNHRKRRRPSPSPPTEPLVDQVEGRLDDTESPDSATRGTP